MKFLQLFILYIAFLIVPGRTEAQQLWTLQQCVDRALTENVTMHSSDIEIFNNEVNVRMAQESRFPNVNGSIGNNVNLGRTVDPTTNSFNSDAFFSNSYNVNSGVLLYNGGRLKNTVTQARSNLKSSQLSKEQRGRDIALNVATLYLNVLLAKENITIANNNLAQSQAQLAQIILLIDGGARPQNDRYNLDAQIANNEQAIVASQNNLMIALLNLKQAIWLEEDQPFDLANVSVVLDEILDPNLLSVDELYTIAEKNQSSIQAARYNVLAAETGIEIARAQFLPSVSLGGFLGTNYSNKGKTAEVTSVPVIQDITINNVPVTLQTVQPSFTFTDTPFGTQFKNNLSYGFGLNVSIPIYNNYQARGNVTKAELNAHSQAIALAQEKQTLRVNVCQALASAKAAKSTMAAAEKSVFAQQRSYENTLTRSRLGSANTFELTNAKTLLDNAELNMLLAKYDYIFRTKVLDFYMGNAIKI